jgi:hypothetical protein
MASQFLCHGCGGLFSHRHGAGLHCCNQCESQHVAVKEQTEEVLKQAGFHQNADVCNLWELNGVHISIEQVMREGMDETLARHRAAVTERVQAGL